MRVAFGHAQLDTEARTLEREGQRVAVEPKVFDLLVYLIEHRERVATSEELMGALWPGISVGPAALSGAVHKARLAVGDDGEAQAVLRTVHGRGFQFVADLSLVPAPEAAAPLAPTGSRARWVAAAAAAALLLAAASVLLLTRPLPEAPPGHALAVLPFVNLSADPDQGYFADGIAEDLLNTVARFDGLRVIGRTSSFSFRNSDADLRTIGQALGADVILEGSVRTEGDRVRITAQLVDAQDGLQRWSESYDRELGGLFAIQTELATAIATALRVELSQEQRQRLATPPTRNLAAYQAYLLGKRRLDRMMTASTEQAVEHFQQAIDLDPRFALAHAGLTESYLELLDSDLPSDQMLARAQAAADKALELDDGLAEAHAALGQVKWYRNDFEGAELAFQHALALNPNSVVVLYLYGNFLWFERARYEEALALSTKAVELDPLSLKAITQLKNALYGLGRFEEALAWNERALGIDPGYADAHDYIGVHQAFVLGRIDEALVWFAKSVSLNPESPFGLTNLGWLFLALGDPDRAEYWIQRSAEVGPDNFYSNMAMQDLALYRGDETVAAQYGRKAFAIFPLEWRGMPLSRLRDHEVRGGRYIEARALYEEHFPELLDERDPRIDDRNYKAAIDLALILSRTGERERADRLLDLSLEQIAKRPRLGFVGYGIADVQIFALQGEKQKALSALRQAIDEGWRRDWWYWLEKKPDLEPLHDDPEYQAMLEEIRADMAAQLERVRELERNGELPEIPPPATPQAG